MISGRPLRVVLTGSECTGKTTLAAALAARFGAPWVPEFSRTYAAALSRTLGPEDVEPIARGQIAAEDAAKARAAGGRLVILDTDLLSTVVYSRHYYDDCPEWIEQAAAQRLADLYLLHHPDIPWLADPQRDRGEERDAMHALFAAALAEYGAQWIDVLGPWAVRESTTVRAVEELLAAPSGRATYPPGSAP